jgi:hypothetical protein
MCYYCVSNVLLRSGRLVRRAEAAGVVPEMRRSLKLLADLNEELVEERRVHMVTQGALAKRDLEFMAKDKYASRMAEQATRLQQELFILTLLNYTDTVHTNFTQLH